MFGTAHAGAVLTINLAAIQSNYRKLRELARNAACAALVKANAYGTGLERVVPALQEVGCSQFFVATLDEAIVLRTIAAVDSQIFVLDGLCSHSQDAFLEFELSPVLNSLSQIEIWNKHARTKKTRLPAAIHFDTGMSRLGLPDIEARQLGHNHDILDGLNIKYIMSHLVSSELPDSPLNHEQLRKFLQIRQSLPHIPASIANSSGIFLGEEYHLDLVRPGVALYGVNPLPGEPNPMSEVVQIKAKISQVRHVDTPQTVGYGATHLVNGPTRIATLPLGYADGYIRSLGGRGYCYIGGIRAPVVGRVSMDLITIDVTSVPEKLAMPGAEVTVIGNSIPIDDLAEAGGTIAYEILTALGSRYRREYITEVPSQ
jgi:alanine racemase